MELRERNTSPHAMAPPARRALEASEPWKPRTTSREHPQGQHVTNHTEDKRRWALLSRTTLWALADRVPTHWENSWHALTGCNSIRKFFTALATRPKAMHEKKFSSWQMDLERGHFLTGPFGFLYARFYCTIVPAVSRTFGRDKRSGFDNRGHCPIGKAVR